MYLFQHTCRKKRLKGVQCRNDLGTWKSWLVLHNFSSVPLRCHAVMLQHLSILRSPWFNEHYLFKSKWDNFCTATIITEACVESYYAVFNWVSHCHYHILFMIWSCKKFFMRSISLSLIYKITRSSSTTKKDGKCLLWICFKKRWGYPFMAQYYELSFIALGHVPAVLDENWSIMV